MARRQVNGNWFSEDGWPIVDTGSCTWVDVPGTENGPQGTVRLQLQNGPPLIVLRAFAADFHAYIEPLRDNDSAAWTAGNSVLGQPGRNNGSNHLGATCMDLNWDGPPEAKVFRYGISKERAYPGDKARRLDELLAFWEPVIFCGGYWSIRDWMHFQLAAGTYDQRNDRPTAKILDFIRDKIRPDGYSTYKRGGSPGTPVPPKPAEPTDASRAVSILSRATGVTAERAQQILPAVTSGLQQSQATNVNRIAMWLAQVGHESVSFQYTEEIAKNGRYAPYIGRTWIQITWESNYRAFSEWAHSKGLVPTPDYFVRNYRELADLKWAGIGAAWYWTVARPKINAQSDARDLYGVTQAINGGQNGAADRKARYDRALALGDQLLILTNSVEGDDELSAEAERMIRELYNEYQANRRAPSRSFFAKDQVWGETPLGFHWNIDGNVNELYMTWGYLLGVSSIEADVEYIAEHGVAPASWAGSLVDGDGKRWLAEVGQQWCQGLVALRAAMQNAFRNAKQQQPQLTAAAEPVVYAAPVDNTRELADAYAEIARLQSENSRLQQLPANTTPPAGGSLAAVEPGGSTGQLIGRAYDALQELRLADALPIEDRAPLAALISVLQTKNGSQV